MKVIISTFSFAPQTGGVAAVAEAQAVGLTARGHEVTVACEFDPRRPRDFSVGTVKVRQFKISGSYELGRGYHGEVREYQEFLASEPADILLCHCPQSWPVDLALPVFPRMRARTVLLSHGVDAHIWKRQEQFPWGIGQWLRSLPYVWRMPGLLRAFDQVVFLSARRDFGRYFDVWLAHWLGLKHCSIIPNGVHLEDLRGAREDFRGQFGIDARQFLLLNVANYCDRKNQLATLRGFLRAERQDATMVFIGQEHNEYSAGMEELLRQAGVRKGRVLILEKVSKDLINSAYRAADLFVLNAKAETQPLAILDAMAVGIPFISTDVGCVAEFPGGLLVKDEAETAAAIRRLLDDSALAQRLGAEGRAATDATYSWDKVITAYERLFSRLLAAAPLRPVATTKPEQPVQKL